MRLDTRQGRHSLNEEIQFSETTPSNPPTKGRGICFVQTVDAMGSKIRVYGWETNTNSWKLVVPSRTTSNADPLTENEGAILEILDEHYNSSYEERWVVTTLDSNNIWSQDA